MISCENISKSFPGQSVIENFSYRFSDTGLYLLYGESGSGKTTFLNILAGFLPFEGGSIEWNGQPFDKQVDNVITKETVEYITQDSFFVDFLTVADNLRLITNDDTAVSDALTRVGLSDKLLQYPTTLSGGEKQRLALARALLSGKRVLLLDEPTAALDDENKRSVLLLISDLSAEMLIICSTHDEKAKKYTDKIIVFTKSKKKAPSDVCVTSRLKKRKGGWESVKATKKRVPYLEKYFSFGKPSKNATVLFSAFLVLSICLCFLADTPQNKAESSIESLYKINSFQVKTYNKTSWSDICPKGFEGRAVMSYGLSTPWAPTSQPSGGSGEMNIPFDSLWVIPFEKEYFRLTDKIKYGTYFTSARQVILSSEMAESIDPQDPESLIGETIQRNVYGLGNIDFEVVGIFDPFDDFEKEYLKSIGISIASVDAYAPEDYAHLCFFNSELMAIFEEDESCYNGSSFQRGYHLYFKSYSEMKAFYKEFSDLVNGNENVRVIDIYRNADLDRVFHIMFAVCMPIAVATSFFSAMFYIELKKIEFMHTCSFISVYEYSGYSKRCVLNKFIWLNVCEFLKIYAVSAIIAFFLTLTVNALNKRFIFISFQIFSYNLWIDAAFLVFVMMLFFCFTNTFFRRIRIRSWYENMIAGRDLI